MYIFFNCSYLYFIDIARQREASGDVILSDLGNGIPFRPGSFDGAISISALQWLCNADKTCHNPVQRLSIFFTTLYAALVSSVKLKINCQSQYLEKFYPKLNVNNYRTMEVVQFFNFTHRMKNKLH